MYICPCNFTAIVKSEVVPEALKEACKTLSSLALRNASTIAGDIALLSDDSYLIPLLLAYDAKLEVFNERDDVMTLDEYIKLNNKKLIIKTIIINPKYNVVGKRISRTSSTKAIVTAARNLDTNKYCVSISSSGFFPSLEELSLDKINSDIYGEKEYKLYLAKELSTLGEDK